MPPPGPELTQSKCTRLTLPSIIRITPSFARTGRWHTQQMLHSSSANLAFKRMGCSPSAMSASRALSWLRNAAAPHNEGATHTSPGRAREPPVSAGPCNRHVGSAIARIREHPPPEPSDTVWCELSPECAPAVCDDGLAGEPRSRSLPPRRLTSTVGTFGSARGQPPGLDGAGGTLRDRRSGHA